MPSSSDDFYRPTPFTPEDLKAIEAKMSEVVARNEPFVREWESRDQSLGNASRPATIL